MLDEKKYWLDDRLNVDKIFWGLCAICGGLALLDLFYHKHVDFSWENWFGFFGFYGFVSCVGLVVLAKQLRKVLKRGEDYYDH